MALREHLRERHMDLDLHVAWLDEEQNRAVFPLWNLTGKISGWQHYRPDRGKIGNNDPRESRYFTRQFEPVAVWGMESWLLTNTLFITEGIFDAARLTERGQSAIAMLSNDPSLMVRKWLWLVRRQRPVVAVCDDDAAGRKLAKLGHQSYTMRAHDLGDASDEEVDHIIREYFT